MYNGVKAMIKREKELTPEVDVKVGSHLHSPSDLKGFPIFPDGTKSLLHKYLSKAVWDELKNAKDKHGFSFKQAIFSGCKNTDSGIGLYAGSHDSYHAFEGLFDKVIEDYHGHKKNAKHISDMDYKKLVTPPLPEDEAAMIKSTRIRVGRNLAEFPLGPGLNKEQRKQIE
jgi:creatine kinase/arginine kinase